MWWYTLFPAILNMSLTAGIAVILVLFVRLPLKKAPKVFSYALWVVVLFRLLCPISFSSGLSLLGIFNTPAVTNGSITYIPTDIVPTANPQVDLPLSGISRVMNETLPQGGERTAADPLEAPMAIAVFVWLFGIAVMLIYSIVSVLILKKHLKGAQHAGRNIYEAANLKTPFVFGIFRPQIYIPKGLKEEEKAYIIRHEQTHIRRLDHIIKPFAFLVLSIHWFNPMVWIAFALMSTDMELSCDERVIKEMGSEIKKAYSVSLFSLAAGKRIINGSPLAFGEGDVKGRIKNVLNYKKPAFCISAAAIIIVTAVGIGLASNPRNDMPAAIKLSITSGETDLIKLGTMAFDQYMSSLTSETTPVDERIASYKLKDISVLAGDISEFCVSLNYDFTTDDKNYVNPSRGAKGKGTWPDNYLEIRIKHVEKDKYEIVNTGTGGGGQGLTPYVAQQMSLEPISVKWSPEQSIDAVGMAELDYASKDIIIFHGYFGLFVYDLNSLQIIRSLDLEPLNCTAIQGDDYCDVTVSADGNTVQLHRMSSNNMYVYTVSDNTLREMPYERMSNRFGSDFVPIEDVVDSDQLGLYSYNAVKFGKDKYGYLHTTDWTLGTFAYVCGDMIYKLFDIREVEAIAKVIKEHPEFPNGTGSKEIIEEIGGPKGSKASVLYETKVEKKAGGLYTVTLTKTWKIKVGGKTPVSYWKYEVTPDKIILVEEDRTGEKLTGTIK